jgi:hypothetical protein
MLTTHRLLALSLRMIIAISLLTLCLHRVEIHNSGRPHIKFHQLCMGFRNETCGQTDVTSPLRVQFKHGWHRSHTNTEWQEETYGKQWRINQLWVFPPCGVTCWPRNWSLCRLARLSHRMFVDFKSESSLTAPFSSPLLRLLYVCPRVLYLFIYIFSLFNDAVSKSAICHETRENSGQLSVFAQNPVWHNLNASQKRYCCTVTPRDFWRVLKNMRKATISFIMFVCPSAGSNSAPTERIFMKFDMSAFFWKSVEKIQVTLKF